MIFFDSGVSSVFILRMVLQETYEVFDCLYYDDCTVATHNTDFFNRSYLSTDYTGDVLKLTATGNNGNYMPNREGTATSIADVTEWEAPFVFEYDVLTFDDGAKNNVGIQMAGRNYTQLGLTNTASHHLKLVYDGSRMSIYVDNASNPVYSTSLTQSTVYCQIGVQSGATQTIKDVKIYPI